MAHNLIRCRKALSNVISTVILSSTILSIVMAASFLANEVLNINVASSEFRTAEDIVFNVNSEISKLIFKPGSSAVIKVSFSSTAPGFVRNLETMNITLEDLGHRHETSIDLGLFKIEGRQTIVGSFDYDLLGGPSLLVSPYNGTLGRIHVSKPRNLRVSLDYSRIRYAYTGILYMFNGSEYSPYNTLEITGIVLTFGEVFVPENAIILIQNEKVLTETFTLHDDCSITASTPDASETIFLSEMGGDPTHPTVVNFHKVYIKISVLEGW